MQVSQNCIALIKKYEGCRLTAYQCSAGKWTIGWGTTSDDRDVTGTNITPGMTITQQTADQWLINSLNNKYARLVGRYGRYNWNQNQFDALVSFAYNIGSINKLTDNGRRSIQEISNAIPLYVNAGGRRLEGLVRRRNEEKALFDRGGTIQQEANLPIPERGIGCITADVLQVRSSPTTIGDNIIGYLTRGTKIEYHSAGYHSRGIWVKCTASNGKEGWACHQGQSGRYYIHIGIYGQP